MLLTPLPSPSDLDSGFDNYPTHRILVAGGSYAGIACILSLLGQVDGNPARKTISMPNLTDLQPNGSVEIVLLDERDGFFHTVGAPLAHTSQRHVGPLWKSYSSIPELQHPALKIVQGRLAHINANNLVASYEESGSRELHHIAYDYLVLATGLSRQWPIVPASHSRSGYVSDATSLISRLSSSERVAVVGGGAVGIEIAAELKHHHPTVNVSLVHSRQELLSNEQLPSEFKAKALELLREEGVDVILGQRAAALHTDEQLASGQEQLQLTDGTVIAAGAVFNATAHCPPNTTCAPKQALDERGYVDVMPSLMFPTHAPNHTRHFAIGDIANVKGIKRAGGALVMGHIAAANLWALLSAGKQDVGLTLGEYPDVGPMMGLAIGEQAIAYNGADCWGKGGIVTSGPDVKQRIFGDDLAWASCLKFMGLDHTNHE